jgi:hypothetical protein
MDNEIDQDEPKISIVVGILATIFFILVDLICLIPGVGDVEDIFGFLGGAIGFVSDAGKELLTTLGVVMGIKAIPFLQMLPAWTCGWLFIWYATNHPSAITDTALKAAQAEASLEGGGVGGEVGELGAVSEAGEGLEGAEAGAQAAAEGGEGAEAIGETTKATEGAEDAGVAAEKAEGTETAEDEAAETGAKNGSGGEGESEAENPVDLETPEEKNPMENLQKDLENPTEDFGNWDNSDGGNNNKDEEEDNEDEEENELPMAA